MSEYVDKYGRWHHKPCINGEPAGNNGWIYTAYASLLGFDVSDVGIWECYQACLVSRYPYVIHRSPNKALPPMSRDEVLGLIMLDCLHPFDLEDQYWQFCDLLTFKHKSLWEINWIKALKTAWKIRKAHRNALWEERDLWHLGFRLPPQDTYFALRYAGVRPHFFHWLYFFISSFLTVKGKPGSGQLILWAKLTSLGLKDSWLCKQINLKAALLDEFGPSHPFLQSKLVLEKN
jgi:hypothetical protein